MKSYKFLDGIWLSLVESQINDLAKKDGLLSHLLLLRRESLMMIKTHMYY